MSQDEARAIIAAHCAAAGSQAKWAVTNGFSPAYVSDALGGRRALGERLLAAVGLRWDIAPVCHTFHPQSSL